MRFDLLLATTVGRGRHGSGGEPSPPTGDQTNKIKRALDHAAPSPLGERRWIGFGVLPCVLQRIGKIGGPTEEDNGPTRRIERHGMGQTRKGSDVLAMRPMLAVKCPGFAKHRV